MSDRYVIWSNEHSAWWAPHARGYTPDLSKAGRYDRDEAIEHARGLFGWNGSPDEIAIPEHDAMRQSQGRAPSAPEIAINPEQITKTAQDILASMLSTMARHFEVLGWGVVPLNATEDMYNAGYDATRLADGTPQFVDSGFVLGHSGQIYRAMLSAAPKFGASCFCVDPDNHPAGDCPSHGDESATTKTDYNGHLVRSSDASSFDEICTKCGATDRAGSTALFDPCPGV